MSARKLAFASLIVFGFGLIAAGVVEISSAQSMKDKLEIGATYSCPQMNDYEFKVISCDDKDWCQVFVVNKFSPKGGNVSGQGKDNILSLIKKNECTVKVRAPKTEDPTEQPADTDKNTDKTDDTVKAVADGDCAPDSSLAEKPKKTDSMELKSKRALLAHYYKEVEEGEKVGVSLSFENFQIGAARINRRGDTLYYEDAPVGAKIYPVKSKFTVCSLFSTEITHDLTDGHFECFTDNSGEWACASASGNRIISTKYDKRKK